MAATITAETGDGSATANSYVTLAQAETYFETHPQATTWASATTDTKNRLLITAARVLDVSVEFIGFKTNSGQAMQWPRILARDSNQYGGAYSAGTGGANVSTGYFASDAIPAGIRDAQCEQARFLLASDRMADATGKGLKSFELTGTMKAEFDGSNLPATIPDFVADMLAQFGFVRSRKSGSVKLTRA